MLICVHTLQKTEKHIHLIMEYCSLGDLSNFIKRKGVLAGASGENNWGAIASPWGGLNEAVVLHFLRQLGTFSISQPGWLKHMD